MQAKNKRVSFGQYVQHFQPKTDFDFEFNLPLDNILFMSDGKEEEPEVLMPASSTGEGDTFGFGNLNGSVFNTRRQSMAGREKRQSIPEVEKRQSIPVLEKRAENSEAFQTPGNNEFIENGFTCDDIDNFITLSNSKPMVRTQHQNKSSTYSATSDKDRRYPQDPLEQLQHFKEKYNFDQVDNDKKYRHLVDSVDKKKESAEKQPRLQMRLSQFLNQIQEVNSIQETSLEPIRHSLSESKSPIPGSHRKPSTDSAQRFPFRPHRCSDIFMTQKENSKKDKMVFNSSRQNSFTKRTNLQRPPTPTYKLQSDSPVPEEQDINKERVKSINSALSVSLKNSQDSLRQQLIAEIMRVQALTKNKREHIEQQSEAIQEQSGLLFGMTEKKRQKIEELQELIQFLEHSAPELEQQVQSVQKQKEFCSEMLHCQLSNYFEHSKSLFTIFQLYQEYYLKIVLQEDNSQYFHLDYEQTSVSHIACGQKSECTCYPPGDFRSHKVVNRMVMDFLQLVNGTQRFYDLKPLVNTAIHQLQRVLILMQEVQSLSSQFDLTAVSYDLAVHSLVIILPCQRSPRLQQQIIYDYLSHQVSVCISPEDSQDANLVQSQRHLESQFNRSINNRHHVSLTAALEVLQSVQFN